MTCRFYATLRGFYATEIALPSVKPEEAARQILSDAIDSRVFPAAVVDVGNSAAPIWQRAFGTFAFEPSPEATLDTVFDLASLTKVIATVSVLMQLENDRALALDDRVSRWSMEWVGVDRERVTLRDLLEHASGLPARLLDRPPAGRREFEYEIGRTLLEYPPRTRSVYSDLGFILLGFVAADCGRAPLAAQFTAIASTLGIDHSVRFVPPMEWQDRTAPTTPLAEDPRRGRTLVAEVNDQYAHALGGVAGHAGLFGTARSVGAFARAVLRAARGDDRAPVPFSAALVRQFTTRSDVPGSSRALGWDTMLPTSSCGTRMSASAFGHVGFTGASLWIDPDRDRYFVLLTNRAHGGGSLDDMRAVRRAFHDALGNL
jgi:CubicO group peptidase (beta-lactamase class C family)